MKSLLSFIGGAALAAIHVAVIGISYVQGSGNESGAVYDLNNVVVAVTEPRLAILSTLSIVALSGLCIAMVVAFSRRLRAGVRNSLRLGYAVAGLAGVVAAYFWTVVPQEGFVAGPRGWVIEGGTMAVYQLCIVISILVLIHEWNDRMMRPVAAKD